MKIDYISVAAAADAIRKELNDRRPLIKELGKLRSRVGALKPQTRHRALALLKSVSDMDEAMRQSLAHVDRLFELLELDQSREKRVKEENDRLLKLELEKALKKERDKLLELEREERMNEEKDGR